MARLDRQWLRKEFRRLRSRHEESRTMLAILMTSIAALFILGIALAYNHAASTITASGTSVPTGPSLSASTATAVNPPAGRGQTSGSGGQPARPNAQP